MDNLDLKCEDCGIDYQKPKVFIEYSENEKFAHLFFKRCLKLCDKCRRKIEREMLKKGLPIVIDAISKP